MISLWVGLENCGVYIHVPLEVIYQAAYEGVPRDYRAILEAPAG